MSGQNDDTNQQNFLSASRGFGEALNPLENPQQITDQRSGQLAQLLRPAFERGTSRYLGDVTAGLGNRYRSTFGQLTLDEAARNSALAKAANEEQIFRGGQAHLDQLVNRAGAQGNLATAAQNIRLQPYQLLNSLLGTTGQQNATANQFNANAFNTQAGMFNSQTQANAQTESARFQALGNVGSSAIGILPYYF